MAVNDDQVERSKGLRRHRIKGFDNQLLVVVERNGHSHGHGRFGALSALEDHIRRKDHRGLPATPRKVRLERKAARRAGTAAQMIDHTAEFKSALSRTE